MEIIKLRHVKNYRDLGGITTAEGRVLRPHMLIRGTTLFAPTLFGIKILKEKYNLKTIIDLRTQKELLEKPDINGGLIGGASLKIDDFKAIADAAAELG